MKKLALAFWLIQAGLAQQDTAAILKSLSEITGLELKKPVQQETMTRDSLKDFFNARIKEAVKPEEIRIEELTLKKFGLVPADFDLKATTVELLAEQAAAFYDYRKKKMVLLDGPGDQTQQLALVHELAHALADQHFNLEKYLGKSNTDDASLARTAVMEGQATWLMSENMSRRLGQSLLDAPILAQAMSRMAAAGGGFPVLDKVPLYMRESLIFPYTQGMMFQQHVAQKLGKQGFTEVFRRAPNTTREILHPELYFDQFHPADAPLPALPEKQKYKELVTGTIGEFDHSILFRQYSAEGAGLAEKWRGGNYRVSEDKRTKRAVLMYASAWENEDAARQALGAWKRIMEGKWKQFRVIEEGDGFVTGESEDGFFALERKGAVISSLEGLPALPRNGK